ncbi:hypothetical protein DAI22_03g078800 [Oryza sativa Japonica Group]|nr:hypothetical protein DAI22_03g078800 [Oryza sativa Japonica Group]
MLANSRFRMTDAKSSRRPCRALTERSRSPMWSASRLSRSTKAAKMSTDGPPISPASSMMVAPRPRRRATAWASRTSDLILGKFTSAMRLTMTYRSARARSLVKLATRHW